MKEQSYFSFKRDGEFFNCQLHESVVGILLTGMILSQNEIKLYMIFEDDAHQLKAANDFVIDSLAEMLPDHPLLENR